MAEPRARRPGTALVLVGHGSSTNPDSGAPTRAHGETLRRLGLFDEVHVAFWKETPRLGEILHQVSAPEVYVVPNLACKGYVTGEVIPREMGLSGPVTRLAGGERTVRLCDPVGEHPRIARVLAEHARAIMAGAGLDPARVCVLLVGHGTTRNRGSAIRTQALADGLADGGMAAEVRCAFLEQEPLVADWARHTAAEAVIVMPFMISNGLHGAEDVPALLGLDPGAPELLRMAREGVPAGPFSVQGRRLWYCRAVGSEALIVEIVLDQVEACDRR